MFSSLFFHYLSVCNVVRLCGKLKLLMRFNALRQRNPIQQQIIHKSNVAFEATTKPHNHTTTQQHNHCNKISVLSSHDKNTTNVCWGREPFNRSLETHGASHRSCLHLLAHSARCEIRQINAGLLSNPGAKFHIQMCS